MKLLFLYVTFGGFVEYVTWIMGTFRINNLWVLNLYDLVQYILLMLIFSEWFGPVPGRRLRYSIVPYSLLWILVRFNFQKMEEPDVFTMSVSSLVILAAAVWGLRSLFMQHERPLRLSPRFWIATGLLVYFCGSIMFFVLGSRISRLTLSDALMVYSIHWGVNASVNVLYSIAFWVEH